MSPQGLVNVIQSLGRVGGDNESGWKRYVIPFIQKAWPKEKSVQTEETSKAWISVLEKSRDEFPILVEAVKAYLRRTSLLHLDLYGFTREVENGFSIPRGYPDHMLEVMDLVVPDSPANVPYQLDAVLQMLKEVKPEIVSDPRFTRLQLLVASR